MSKTNMAMKLVEKLKPRQLAGELYPCPRCGQLTMRADCPALNALSRYADVYICNECGTEEALGDMMGRSLPLTEWSMVWSFIKGGAKRDGQKGIGEANS